MKHHTYLKEDSNELSEKSDQLLALSRVGIAASDSDMNLDLEDCGYCGLFEVMATLSRDLTDELVEREVHGNKPTPTPRDPNISAAVPFAEQSPVMTLFAQWLAIQNIAHEVTDEEHERLCDRASKLEAEMMPLPITDPSDLAAKMIAHTNNFAFASSGPHAEKFQQQVRAFVGGLA